jgi:hypothetical protein
MDYSELIENGELSDAGIDLAVQVSNGDLVIPDDLPEEVKTLIEEAVQAMALGLVGALPNG